MIRAPISDEKYFIHPVPGCVIASVACGVVHITEMLHAHTHTHTRTHTHTHTHTQTHTQTHTHTHTKHKQVAHPTNIETHKNHSSYLHYKELK